MKNIHMAALALAAWAFASCGEDFGPAYDVTPLEATPEAVTVKDGILHFATKADYNEFSLRMANSDPEDRRAWEKEHGFTSMLSYAERITGDIDLHIGEAIGRPDIFSVAEDSTVTLEVPDAFASAADADGYYYIGSSACKVDREFTALVDGGGKEEADAAIKRGAVPDGLHGSVYRYAGSGSLKAGYVGKKVNVISKRIRNDRYRMDYSIKVLITDNDANTGSVTLYVEQKSTNGYKKHRRWRDHHSENTYRDVTCEVNHPFFENPMHICVSNYFGKSRVNHSWTEPFYLYGKKGIDYSSESPYFTGMNGSIICESVPREQISLWMLFNGYDE